jgi:tRNA threonylcarbamoyl adenosine modification protein YeaZ
MILSIQTCFETLSVSLFTTQGIHLSTSFVPHKHSQASLIDDVVNHCLRANNVNLDSLSAIVVANGPGSFTGIRIGLAFTEGLTCFNNSLQKFFVSNANACLVQVDCNTKPIAVILPSIRGESYIQFFSSQKDPLSQIVSLANKDIDAYLEEQIAKLQISSFNSLQIASVHDLPLIHPNLGNLNFSKINLPNSYHLSLAYFAGLVDSKMLISSINYVRDAVKLNGIKSLR